ncbi:MAG: DUF6491 family protein [Pseudomonadales bacterium]
MLKTRFALTMAMSLVLAFAGLSVAAATAEEASPEQPGQEESRAQESAKSEKAPLPPLDELLERSGEDPEVYTERCLSTSRIRSHEVLDAQHLVFKMSNKERYLVQFPHRCIGLRRGSGISYETHSSRLCKMDSIRPLENRGLGIEPGIPCYIDEFQKVTPEQIEFLKEALRAQRRR